MVQQERASDKELREHANSSRV